MNVLAIDPGTTESGYVLYDGERVAAHGIKRNEVLRDMLTRWRDIFAPVDHMAIEMVQSYGMAVGKETFETVWWTGRFCESAPCPFTRVFRSDVKIHLCNSVKAKDANIRQALIDKHGGSKALAIGLKKTPGPLYGLKSHEWAALAVAVTYLETRSNLKVIA